MLAAILPFKNNNKSLLYNIHRVLLKTFSLCAFEGGALWPLIFYQSSDLKSFLAGGFLPCLADGEVEVLRMGLIYLRLMDAKETLVQIS